ncbi:MAG: hypothetical protein HETSPECPRED_006894 [Heterodermia speciosa]|uniref:RelA/SpoT domain-containing protein n=1 Tax=Heterodermia speciosa TaxID=116794 RepID=A0A8H3FP90_9LECA|nr:MAG: hypothetical protein HETSPECPRED_006894 [Heterodermia speciosa]
MSSTGGSGPSDQKDPVLLTKYGWPETRRQFEKLITLTREEYDQRVLAFIKKYAKPETQMQFERLVALTRETCEKLLEQIRIKGVVQGRIKKCDSLKEKLEVPDENPNEDFNDEVNTDEADEADAELEEASADTYDENGEIPNVRDWIYKRENIYKHPEMGDLAGIRIGLYFPDDIEKVAVEIEKYFRRKHRWGSVRDGREATQGRNLDHKGHLTIGAWVSPETNDHWEHYGYKSWQVVVQWKENPLELPKSEDLRSRLTSLRKEMPKGFKSLRVEIQIGTVVTQAWAEVQHNIIYKKPANILATPSMKRMIDATNGLAITTEIMLKELQKGVEDAKKEAEDAKKEAEDARKQKEEKGREAFETMQSIHGKLGSTALEFMRKWRYDDWVSSWNDGHDILKKAGSTKQLSDTDYHKLRRLTLQLQKVFENENQKHKRRGKEILMISAKNFAKFSNGEEYSPGTRILLDSETD